MIDRELQVLCILIITRSMGYMVEMQLKHYTKRGYNCFMDVF